MPSPKPKPTALKVVTGTFRKDRVAPKMPRLKPEWPPCPSFLSERAKKAWPALCKTTSDMGVLTGADGMALSLLCEAIADWLEAKEDVAINGLTYTGEGSSGQMITKANPAVAMRNEAWRRVQSALASFGMDPSSRTKVNSVKEGEDGDEFDF